MKLENPLCFFISSDYTDVRLTQYIYLLIVSVKICTRLIFSDNKKHINNNQYYYFINKIFNKNMGKIWEI